MEVIVLDLKNWKNAFPVITIALLLIAAALLAVQAVFLTVDVETVPAAFQGLFVFVKNVFTGTVFAVGLIWLRNSWGYVEAYAQKKVEGQAELEYDVNKFYKTAAYYVGNVAIIFNVAPTPELRAIGTAIVFFLDVTASTLAKIFKKTSK